MRSVSAGQDPKRHKVHSSMYARLRTNLPREVMAYTDFAFDDLAGRSQDARRFPSHEEVRLTMLHFLLAGSRIPCHPYFVLYNTADDAYDSLYLCSQPQNVISPLQLQTPVVVLQKVLLFHRSPLFAITGIPTGIYWFRFYMYSHLHSLSRIVLFTIPATVTAHPRQSCSQQHVPWRLAH